MIQSKRRHALNTREDYQNTFFHDNDYKKRGFVSKKLSYIITNTDHLSIATFAEEIGGIAQGMRAMFEVKLTQRRVVPDHKDSGFYQILDMEDKELAKINGELYPKIAHYIIKKTKRVEEYAKSVQLKVLERWQAAVLAKGGDAEAINSYVDMFTTVPLISDSGQETEAMTEVEKVTNQHAVAFVDLDMIRETMAVIRAALIDDEHGLNVVTIKKEE